MDSIIDLPFRLKILGGFDLRLRGESVDLSTRKTACLLAYLACTAPTPQPRERLATLLWSAGSDERARHNLRQAILGLRQILGHDAVIAGHSGSLGIAYALGGNMDDGLPLVEQAISDFDRMRHHMGLSLFLVPLAGASLLAGNTDKARALAGRALHLALEKGYRIGEAGARHVLAETEARDGDLEQSLQGYLDALALAQKQGLRPLVARCQHGLGELYLTLREPAKAQASLGIAAAMYQDMGMKYWAERTRHHD